MAPQTDFEFDLKWLRVPPVCCLNLFLNQTVAGLMPFQQLAEAFWECVMVGK